MTLSACTDNNNCCCCCYNCSSSHNACDASEAQILPPAAAAVAAAAAAATTSTVKTRQQTACAVVCTVRSNCFCLRVAILCNTYTVLTEVLSTALCYIWPVCLLSPYEWPLLQHLQQNTLEECETHKLVSLFLKCASLSRASPSCTAPTRD
jgi:hypothetical protein